MNIKLNPIVNIRTLLLAAPLLISGCQMLEDASAAGNETGSATAPAAGWSSSGQFRQGWVSPPLPVPAPPLTGFASTAAGTDLNAVMARSIQMAESRMEFKPAPNPSSVSKPVFPTSAGTAWPDLGAIASKSIQIAESKADNNQAAAARRQAELRRMVEQQFRQ